MKWNKNISWNNNIIILNTSGNELGTGNTDKNKI